MKWNNTVSIVLCFSTISISQALPNPGAPILRGSADRYKLGAPYTKNNMFTFGKSDPEKKRERNQSYYNCGFVEFGIRLASYRFTNFMITDSKYTNYDGKAVDSNQTFYWDAQKGKYPLFFRVQAFQSIFWWYFDIAGSVSGGKNPADFELQKNQYTNSSLNVDAYSRLQHGRIWAASSSFLFTVGGFLKPQSRWGLYAGGQGGFHTVMPMQFGFSDGYKLTKLGGTGIGFGVHAFAPMFSGLFRFSYMKDFLKVNPIQVGDEAKSKVNSIEMYWVLPFDHDTRGSGLTIAIQNRNFQVHDYLWKKQNLGRNIGMNYFAFQIGMIITNFLDFAGSIEVIDK